MVPVQQEVVLNKFIDAPNYLLLTSRIFSFWIVSLWKFRKISFRGSKFVYFSRLMITVISNNS